MDMEHWSGFTDVELNSLKQRGRGRRSARRSRGQPLNQGTRKLVYPIGRPGDDATKANPETLPRGAFLSGQRRFSPSSNSVPVDVKQTDIDNASTDANSSAVEKGGKGDVEKDSISSENSGDSGVALTESPPTSLEEMQKQQRLIEELNKKKKAMLQETIQQRYKQTQQESKTLAIVNQELTKLDNMISTEISILRERIEEANRQYNAARKRFERAEKEYVEAKVALHHSTEHKELLAEHLCAVIQENEIRKAKKLEELMVKLNMAVGGDESSVLPKVLVYQRTPTPRYEHWPQNHSMRDNSHSLPDANTENNKSVTDIVTKPDASHSDSMVSSNSSHDSTSGSHDPPSSSHDPPSNSDDPPSSSHDPSSISHDPPSSSQDPSNSSHDPPSNSYDPSNSSHDPPSNSYDPSNSSHDPASGLHAPDSGSKDPQGCSHDPDNDHNNSTQPVDNSNSINTSQDLNNQVNS